MTDAARKRRRLDLHLVVQMFVFRCFNLAGAAAAAIPLYAR